MSERHLYEALIRLRNDKALSPILDWLKSLREDARNRLETQVDNLQVEQGKSQILKKLLAAIEDAPEILSKIVK